ncbi:MAG: hypothetical protein LBH77_02970 [Tannerella sp.]|jgi:hypothetical protein|nr:hypothetical protein [Tannerella sp.]
MMNSEDYTGGYEQLDDADVELYSFVPFTDEEMKTLPYEQKLEKRQIPESFLLTMTTKSLFYQYFSCELSKGMYISNTAQQGFVAMKKQLNMLPELLNRRNAGKTLMDLLEKTELPKLDDSESFHFYGCLERILVQPEVIGNMTDEETDRFIRLARQVRDTIVRLSGINKKWENPESLAAIMFGLGNVMLEYEYEPFMNLVESNTEVGGLMAGGNLRSQQSEECVLLINDCIGKFIEFKK